MNAERFIYKEITDIILKSFYETYNELGDGFFVYDNVIKNIRDDQRRSAAE